MGQSGTRTRCQRGADWRTTRDHCAPSGRDAPGIRSLRRDRAGARLLLQLTTARALLSAALVQEQLGRTTRRVSAEVGSRARRQQSYCGLTHSTAGTGSVRRLLNFRKVWAAYAELAQNGRCAVGPLDFLARVACVGVRQARSYEPENGLAHARSLRAELCGRARGCVRNDDVPAKQSRCDEQHQDVPDRVLQRRAGHCQSGTRVPRIVARRRNRCAFPAAAPGAR